MDFPAGDLRLPAGGSIRVLSGEEEGYAVIGTPDGKRFARLGLESGTAVFTGLEAGTYQMSWTNGGCCFGVPETGEVTVGSETVVRLPAWR